MTRKINDSATKFLRFPTCRKFEKAEEEEEGWQRSISPVEIETYTRKRREYTRTRTRIPSILEGIARCKAGQPWEEIDEILRASMHPSRGILFEGVEVFERGRRA